MGGQESGGKRANSWRRKKVHRMILTKRKKMIASEELRKEMNKGQMVKGKSNWNSIWEMAQLDIFIERGLDGDEGDNGNEQDNDVLLCIIFISNHSNWVSNVVTFIWNGMEGDAPGIGIQHRCGCNWKLCLCWVEIRQRKQRRSSILICGPCVVEMLWIVSLLVYQYASPH